MRRIAVLLTTLSVVLAFAPPALADGPNGPPETIRLARQITRWNNGHQFKCEKKLWMRESGWHTTSANSSSSAYGIPQLLTSYMKNPAKYKHNTDVQIRAGENYIRHRYHKPCRAWAHWRSNGWY